MTSSHRFEVRPVVYGGGHGPRLSSHKTLDEAEAAHSSTDSQELLVILGPDPKDPKSPLNLVVHSRRLKKGKWEREI